MVLVFHLNYRLVQYKFLLFIAILFLILIFFIHTFEITYHLLNCPNNDEPIDVVYTWVNGSDLEFLNQLNSYLRKHAKGDNDYSPQRYDDKNELKFSLRSLEKYAPWVNHVYIVTNGQIPYWLNLDYEKVTLITHKEIFDDLHDLPTFSSPAIESHLHRIPGLSKRFIYFNDDIFLRSPIFKDDFVSSSRGFLIYLAWLVPMCSSECSWLYVADGHCDNVCNNPNCQMDGGDCDDSHKTVLGDIIVKFEDYEIHETKKPTTEKYTNEPSNYSNIARHLHEKNPRNVSEFIDKHNKKVILLDKLKRRKLRKRTNSQNGRNVDAYAASLQYTNRLLNQFYGFSVRKVPAHAPIMVDKTIMEEMQKKFRKQFKITSRNRIRSTNDVQFAFAYYYYVIHEKIRLKVGEIFDEFDTDMSGVWSDSEIRTVLTKLYDLPLNEDSIEHFTNILMNCTKSSYKITKELLENCPKLASNLMDITTKYQYKYEIIRDAEKKFVHFKMLNSNITEVLNQLDDVRRNVKKFVCLNDNLDQSQKSDNEIIRRLLYDFYISLFPVPSKYELPEYYRNRFLYIDDYTKVVRSQQQKLLLGCFIFTLLVFSVFLNFFRRRICELINKLFF